MGLKILQDTFWEQDASCPDACGHSCSHRFLPENRTSRQGELFFPMVETVEDRDWLLGVLEQELKPYQEARKIPQDWRRAIPVGIMIETVAALNNLNALLDKSKIDFVSIGTNDLTKELFNTSRNSSHRAWRKLDAKVLRAIEQVVKIAAERGIAVNVCGEVAGWSVLLCLRFTCGKIQNRIGDFAAQASVIPHLKAVDTVFKV